MRERFWNKRAANIMLRGGWEEQENKVVMAQSLTEASCLRTESCAVFIGDFGEREGRQRTKMHSQTLNWLPDVASQSYADCQPKELLEAHLFLGHWTQTDRRSSKNIINRQQLRRSKAALGNS